MANSTSQNKSNKTSSSVDKLSTGFSNAFKPNEEDVKSLNKRGNNATDHSASFRKRNKYDDDENENKSEKPSELEKKDELPSKDGLKEKEDKNPSKKNSLGGSIKKNITNKIIGDSFIGNIISKWKKAVLMIKIAIISGAVLLVVFIFFFLVTAFDYVGNAISSFFGIPITDSEENMSLEKADGLLTQEKYMYNPDTGEEYKSIDELVTSLSEDNSCSKVTFWNEIGDWFDSLDGKFGSVCAYIRYIDSKEKEIEKDNPGLILDRSLIISTIFYGYASQPSYSQMKDPTSVKDQISAMDYFGTLKDVLSSGVIKRDDLDKIIEASVLKSSHNFYTWDIEDKYDDNGNLISSTGVCKETKVEDTRYNLMKWNIFMRFGEDAANTYESEISKQKIFDESTEECNGTLSESELLSLVSSHGAPKVSLDSSVYEAQKYSTNKSIDNISLFEQAASTTGSNVDTFTPYDNNGVHVDFDYKNGFIYKKFPMFESAIKDSNIEIEYDNVVTPKEIETIRTLIVEKKPYMNEILHLEDQDEPYRYLYNADTETSVVLGAFCGDYLTSPIDQIRVTIKDCDGRNLTTTTMKDYITGVAYREVSDKEDDYVKAEMVAALSYALHRRNNYSKGNVITMRSGNCDQAYCSMRTGCHGEKSALSCGSFKCTSYIPGPGSSNNTGVANTSLITKYEAYYEEIKDFLLVDSNSVFGAHYTSTTQNEWYRKASNGMSYTQILQETYANEGATLIRCSDKNSGPSGENTENNSNQTQIADNSQVKYGNGIVDGKYTQIAPDMGKFYGFSYGRSNNNQEININPVWIENNITTINSNCTSASWTENYEVNVQAKENYKQAFSNICKLLTTGVKLSDGTTCKYTKDNLSGGHTFIQKETISGMASDLAYGITQDWNYDKTYSINGKSFSPYNSSRSLENYLEFVKELGKEEDCRNVNYILYKYAYEPAGFTWGGNNGRNGNSGVFNGMHYRIDY